MGCFSLDFVERLCIFIVIIIALWSLIKLCLPFLTQFLPAIVIEIIKIVIWAVIAIICIVIIFALLSCLLSAGGGLLHFPAR
jgi:hypothetical protein